MEKLKGADKQTRQSDLLISQVISDNIRCYCERPRNSGLETRLQRMDAFDLFNVFTADIIREKTIFTR